MQKDIPQYSYSYAICAKSERYGWEDMCNNLDTRQDAEDYLKEIIGWEMNFLEYKIIEVRTENPYYEG